MYTMVCPILFFWISIFLKSFTCKKDYQFSIVYLWKISWVYYVNLFPSLLFVLAVLMPCCFDHYSFVTYSKSCNIMASLCSFFDEDCISAFLQFHTNHIYLLCKECSFYCNNNCCESVDVLGGTSFLTSLDDGPWQKYTPNKLFLTPSCFWSWSLHSNRNQIRTTCMHSPSGIWTWTYTHTKASLNASIGEHVEISLLL